MSFFKIVLVFQIKFVVYYIFGNLPGIIIFKVQPENLVKIIISLNQFLIIILWIPRPAFIF